MTKELFNRAMSELDGKLIDDYFVAKAKLKKKRTVRLRSVAAAVAAMLILIVSFPFIGWFLRDHGDDGPDEHAFNEWIITSNTASTVQRSMTLESGTVYMMNANYSELSVNNLNEADIDLTEDVGAQLYGQWLLSLGTFDYSMHFELFQKELLDETVYKDFSDSGFTPEEAYQKIRKVAAETSGVKDCRVDYYVSDIRINDEETINYYRDNWESMRIRHFIEKVEDIEAFATYYVENSAIYFNDMFYIDDIDFGDFDMICYKYKGTWYVDSDYLDDDLSIDLVQSDPGEDGYYKEKSNFGVVESIESGYIKLEGSDRYYLVPESINDISVGDTVTVNYYSIGIECKRITDGANCKLGTAFMIEKHK